MSVFRIISIEVACLCLLLVACGSDVDITPEPATEENLARLERYLKPGYTLHEVYQHALGESEAVANDSLLEPNGTVIVGLTDGPGVEGRMVALYFGPTTAQGVGRVVNMGLSGSLDIGSISRSTGDFPNARTLVNYVRKQR